VNLTLVTRYTARRRTRPRNIRAAFASASTRNASLELARRIAAGR
jgi:hypothetical protein